MHATLRDCRYALVHPVVIVPVAMFVGAGTAEVVVVGPTDVGGGGGVPAGVVGVNCT